LKSTRGRAFARRAGYARARAAGEKRLGTAPDPRYAAQVGADPDALAWLREHDPAVARMVEASLRSQ
jgi:hypothetical protein